MEYLTFYFLAIFVGSTLSALTEWTVLLWLRSNENMEPFSVWSDDASTYNSGTNHTLGVLLSSSVSAHRNMIIDRWSDNPPDRIKLTYRNNEGVPVYSAVFNSTDTSSQNWFDAARAISGFDNSWSADPFLSNDCHNASFVVFDNSWGANRYIATSITLDNGTVMYIVGNKGRPYLLPAVETESPDCHPSIGVVNPLQYNITVTDMTHQFCSSLCRDRNYKYGAAHNVTCSCIPEGDLNVDSPVGSCVLPCEGDPTELCGGSIAPSAVAFNLVQTDIDVADFNQPLEAQFSTQVTGATKISYSSPKFVFGFNITTEAANLPISIDMYTHHRSEHCNDSTMDNITTIKTFTMSQPEGFYVLDMQPFLVQCLYIYLYESSTTNALSFSVTVEPIILQGAQFATMDILTIEAAWETADLCECECWAYNLLYGDSPFDNLTYAEIEAALKNVTDQIVKELSVNVSTLSSTIRKKTSADDSRQSSTAIGYSLGVAILVSTLVAIVLADVPKILAGVKILQKSCINIFGSHSVKISQK